MSIRFVRCFLLAGWITSTHICFCGQSLGDVRKSPWPDSGPPRLPGLISEANIGLPSSLSSDRDVYFSITVHSGEPMVTMSLFARESVDPERLATVLSTTTRTAPLPRRTVYWRHAGEYSVAMQYTSPDFFLARQIDIRIPAGAMISYIQSVGFRPHVLLRIDEGCACSSLEPSPAKIEGYRWYNLSGVPPDMMVSCLMPLHWSQSQLRKTVGIFLAFPLSALLFLALAVMVGRCERLSASRRRAWYTGIYLGGISCVLICLSVAVFAFWERASTWILPGTSSKNLFLIVPAEAVLILCILATGWLIGPRILPTPKGETQKELFPLYPIWWIALLALFQPLYQLTLNRAHGYPIILGGAILATVFLLWMVFSSRVAWLWARNRLAICEVDEELTAKAKEIARRMNVSIKDVRIDPTEDGRHSANALVFTNHGYIVIAHRSLNALSAEHMDWLLAHEIAHVKHGFPLVRRSPYLFLAATTVGLSIILMSERRFGTISNVSIFIAWAVLLAIFAIVDNRHSRNQEFAADREALINVRNLQTAQEALKLLVQASKYPKMHEKDTTHPALSKRLAALESAADELGIPRESPHPLLQKG